MTMQANNPTFGSVPTTELILLARHVCRITGSISLTTLLEYFPSIDMKCNLKIIDSLISSGHVKRSSKGNYAFINLENRLDTGELEEEVDTLKKVKQRILNLMSTNSTSGTSHPVMSEKSKFPGTLGETTRSSESREETVRNSTLAEELERDLTMITTQRPLFTNCEDRSDYKSSSKLVAANPSKAFPWKKGSSFSQGEIDFVDPLAFKLERCVCSPDPLLILASEKEPIKIPMGSTQPVSPTTSNVRPGQFSDSFVCPAVKYETLNRASQINQHIQQVQQKYQWKKPIREDEVKDPRKALEIFCAAKRMTPPAYTVTFMPKDNVYYCLVLVGNRSFKSYPTMSLSEKRATEVAAEKAVEALGLTNSIIRKLIVEPASDSAN